MTIPYTIPWERDIHTRVSVSRADGFTWVDLLPFVSSLDVASGTVTRFGGRISGIDGVMPQLDLVLRQDLDNVLNPQDQNSAWNKVGGQYQPLLAPMREVFIAAAITPPGVQPSSSDWIGLFHGYLGDGIRVENDIVRLTCRSLSKRLQETYVENPKDYGSESGTPVEHVMQEVLDDNGLSDVILYCPEPTGFMVETYSAENVQYKTVWDVLQALATAYGFFLGDLWDPITESMRLTLLVPPRDKDINTADFVLNYRSDFLREEREIRDTAVRNVIIGHYWDKAANEKRTIIVKDDSSIGQFGRRAMEVSEEATSLIQTETEMLTFLHAILSDLKDQQGTSYLSMPFFPEIGLFSGLVIHHPSMSSTDDFMGVESYRHSLNFESREYRTEIVGSGRIRGGQQRWLKSETKPGSPGNPSAPPTSNVPPPNVEWGHCSFITDVSLSWEPVQGATAYEIRTDSNWGYADGIVYRGNSLSHKFAPTQREYTLYLKAINQAGLYSEQATPITVSLPAPNPPPMPTLTPYFNALKIVPTPLVSPSIMGYYIYITQGDVTTKVPIIAGGDYTYPASSGTTVTIQVSAYDVLGEGPKSEPLQATTTQLGRADLPAWVKEPLKNIEEKWVIDTDEAGNISGLFSVKDAENRSHIAVLVDRFSIATPEGREQIFVFDAEERKLYLRADITAEGLIRATEVQAEVAKALLLQAELAYLDEANILHLRADKITVGGSSPGLVLPKPQQSHLWHFDKTLQSTDGITPFSADGGSIVISGGIAGGALELDAGGSLVYDLPSPVTNFTWAGFYEEG